jgi:hypothetical protein
MEKVFASALFILLAIGLGFVLVWVLSRFTKFKVTVDLFAAVNCVFYAGLMFNLYFAFTQKLSALITVGVILGILFYRKKSTGRWI